MSDWEIDSELQLIPLTTDVGELPHSASWESIGPTSSSRDNLATQRNSEASFDAAPSRSRQQAELAFALDGDVVLCHCPECLAPMTVRLWLMVADCWQCGISIELTEEQQRTVQALIDSTGSKVTGQPAAKQARDRRAGKRLANEPFQPHPHLPTLPPIPPPGPLPVGRGPLAPPPVLSVPGPPANHVFHRTRDATRRLLESMPAWLISLLFHLLLLTILALITFDQPRNDPFITLSTIVDSHVRTGDGTVWFTDDIQFDLPIPTKERPRSVKDLEDLMEADRDARQLRIPPDTTDPNLPPLDHLKRMIASDDDAHRTLAVRDPRVRVELVRREGGTTLTEAAVARGLRWMAQHQNGDGSWSLDAFHRHPNCRGRCKGRGRVSSDAAGTALVLLPFLGAGQTHITGIYHDTVSAGLRFLLDVQKPNGDLRIDRRDDGGMYTHGQAAIVLCETFAMTRDERFRDPARRAIEFIVRSQHPAGGWRYEPGERGDTSVLGWQLMALQSARASGIEVPSKTLMAAESYLDSVQDYRGARYAYQPGRRFTAPMTAEALLCRVYLGWQKGHSGLSRGVHLLVRDHPPHVRSPNFYYWYYATQLMHHFGGEAWLRWNEQIRDVLVQTQVTRGHEAGSWQPRGGYANRGGRLYVTSLATCCLEVYYRHAPVFRRIHLK